MNEKYYVLYLDDPATPSFCSFDKLYVGTEADIKKVADNLAKNNSYPKTAEAIYSYFKGNHSAEHSIAYQTRVVLQEVDVEARNTIKLADKRWTHDNAWGFPYYMKCESVRAYQIVFRFNDKVYRCVKAKFKNLEYKIMYENWHKLSGWCWGNAAVLEVNKNSDTEDAMLGNILYVEEEQYEDVAEAIKDMRNKKKLEFKRICDEIFGDG